MPRGHGQPVPLSPRIRQRLAQARIDAGLSQSQLAERLGVHVQTISGVETGRKPPARHLLDRWCAAIGLACEVETRVTLRRVE